MSLIDRLGRRALFLFDPETAHGLSISALRCGLPAAAAAPRDARLKVSVCGLDFPNPLGMAAGYDKNAEVPDALLSLGFGFAEAGTITPLPQPGNPKPRIFRLTQDEAVINRLGFNNEGHEAATRRLAARKGRPGIVGVNVGANKDSADRIADYEKGVARFAALASYLTINISSPNTPGLRNMQARAQLAELLARVTAARNAAPARPPIFLKIAPDLAEAELEDIAAEVTEKDIDGVIVSNTTISRPHLRTPALAAGQFVEEAFGKRFEAEIGDGALDMAAVVRRRPSFGIGKAAEGDEVAHGEPRGDGIVLTQDGEPARQHVARRGGDVEPVDQHAAAIHRQQPADHRKQRGLAGAVGADDGGDAARRQRQRHCIDHHGLAIGLGDAACLDQRTVLRRMRAMKVMPPRNSMMMESAVLNENTRSSTSWPPTRQIVASSTATGSTTAWREVPAT